LRLHRFQRALGDDEATLPVVAAIDADEDMTGALRPLSPISRICRPLGSTPRSRMRRSRPVAYCGSQSSKSLHLAVPMTCGGPPS
jgi:hypothetical protein